MNIASLELCKELYELSGWELDEKNLYLKLTWWSYQNKVQEYPVERYKLLPDQIVAPAYGLGFLLRKLPIGVILRDERVMGDGFAQGWMCALHNDTHSVSTGTLFNHPEDAAARLAIELFKQGVLFRKMR